MTIRSLCLSATLECRKAGHFLGLTSTTERCPATNSACFSTTLKPRKTSGSLDLSAALKRKETSRSLYLKPLFSGGDLADEVIKCHWRRSAARTQKRSQVHAPT